MWVSPHQSEFTKRFVQTNNHDYESVNQIQGWVRRLRKRRTHFGAGIGRNKNLGREAFKS